MTTDPDAELQKERGTNERYMRELKRYDDEAKGRIVANTASPRNGQWVGGTVSGGLLGQGLEPLIGRVALSEEDPDLGMGFYIGSGFLQIGDMVVIRWVAPMAQLFYKGSDAQVDIAESLAARRTFTRAGNDLTGFEDEVEPGIEHPPFESLARSTAPRSKDSQPLVAAPPVARPPVATPPGRVIRPQQPATPRAQPIVETPEPENGPAPASVCSDAPVGLPEQDADDRHSELADRGQVMPPVSVEETAAETPATPRLTGLRAPRTVLSALNAPRTGRLNSLLRTLQPQQYELVTWPEDEHLIVQGHPGTGKTVIGLHRAAYLTDPDRLEPGGRAPKGEVLVLGPTAAYVDHVKPVLEELAPKNYTVWSLAHFYAQLGDFIDPNLPTDSDHISTSADPLGAAVLRMAENYTGPRTPKAFADYVFRVGDDVRAVVQDSEVLDLLKAGKSHEHARGHSRFHPLLALAGLVVTDVALADRFRHVIVDEAQDLRPIDLQMLRLLVSHGLNLTLLGDMNQRRSDFTHASWDEVAREVGIERDDGRAPLTAIALGYRSTNQILRYAAGLLPRNEQTADALRDGPEPRTISCRSASELCTRARTEALALQQSTGGLVAILTLRPKEMSDHLRTKGWKRGHRQHSWKEGPDAAEMLVLHPDLARGLEFDGVVVIEPSEFPALLGRHGVLYTSLTRATKQLSVVHSRALPKGLKVRRS